MGLTAYYRSCALISGTIAGLPLRVLRKTGELRSPIDHWLKDSPAGPYDMAAFSWTQTVMLHLLNYNEAFLSLIRNAAGVVIGAWPIHPLAVTDVKWEGNSKVFTIAITGGTQEYRTSADIVHVVNLSTDGLRGISPLTFFRQALQTSIAGEKAANKSFISGATIAGLVTTDEDVTEAEAAVIKASLNNNLGGVDHAGEIAFVNRALKFSPWQMSNADAQFIESRGLQVEEVARMFGLPLNLLSVGGAVSNWGTGVAEANLGLQKYVLTSWTSLLESSYRRFLQPDEYAEYDYKGLLQGTPKDEIDLLLAQIGAGLLSLSEARAILNRPPLPAGGPNG